MTPKSPLIDQFTAASLKVMDREGVNGLRVFYLSSDGDFKPRSISIDMDVPTGMGFIAGLWQLEAPLEMVFGFDRFTGPKQGTTLKDCMTITYYDGSKWHFGVMEYQFQPRIVKEISWDNQFWKEVVREEMERATIFKTTGICREAHDGKHVWGDFPPNDGEYCKLCLNKRP